MIDLPCSLARFQDQLVNVLLGADIDADGRLVDDQDVALRGQPFGDADLLLVAAAQAVDRLVRPVALISSACM